MHDATSVHEHDLLASTRPDTKRTDGAYLNRKRERTGAVVALERLADQLDRQQQHQRITHALVSATTYTVSCLTSAMRMRDTQTIRARCAHTCAVLHRSATSSASRRSNRSTQRFGTTSTCPARCRRHPHTHQSRQYRQSRLNRWQTWSDSVVTLVVVDSSDEPGTIGLRFTSANESGDV